MVSVLLTLLLWSLVEVHGQNFPHVAFMGSTVPNHGYVNLSQVGVLSSNTVQCHTDLTTCCTGAQGPHRGDWFAPGETTRLPFSGDITENRVAQRVDLHRKNNANSPVGIYRCDIPTNAVHVPGGNSVRDTIYVGLYTDSGGKIKKIGDSPCMYIIFIKHVYNSDKFLGRHYRSPRWDCNVNKDSFI